jgi:spoIIIJ-associated protein
VEWVEASGKSLSDAKEIVLDLLGVAEDDAELVILSEPKAGLFGRMRGEARIRARVRPVVPRPKRGRRPRPEKGRGPREESRRSSGNGKSGGGERAKRTTSGSNGRGNSTGKGEAVTGVTTRPADGPSRAERPDRSPRGQRSATGSGANGRAKQGKQTGPSAGDSEDTMEESLTLEQQGEAAKEFVAGLVREFGLQADVAFAEIDEDTVQVSATGDDLGLLVGPRGATLAAVQDLARTFVQRQSENRTDRILVDVGGYREKRSAALRRFAEGIVAEVKDSGEERALEPMSPADRKVVHDTVNEMDGVETRSAGTEPSRYVVIQPST